MTWTSFARCEEWLFVEDGPKSSGYLFFITGWFPPSGTTSLSSAKLSVVAYEKYSTCLDFIRKASPKRKRSTKKMMQKQTANDFQMKYISNLISDHHWV
jgi:hypothetical protein